MWAAPFLYLAITLAAALLGAQVLAWIRRGAAFATRDLPFACAAGLLLIGSFVAVIGWFGLLKTGPVLALLVICALVGIRRAREVVGAVRGGVYRLRDFLDDAGPRGSLLAAAAIVALVLDMALLITGIGEATVLLVGGLCVAALLGTAVFRPRGGIAWLLLAWAVVTLVGALGPPTGNDWDGLAEHLAQAKVYARTGQFQPLWYDHHSHFPSVCQMLFSVGMLLQGASLAKLFHWGFGIICLGAAFLIGRRFMAPGAGKWSALVLAGTPMIGWLMQVGYVDLSTTAFGLLAVLGFLEWRRSREASWLVIAGLMAGGAMATKMQGIPLFGVLAAGAMLTAWRTPGPRRLLHGVRAGVLFAVVALLVSGPWYVKTWLVTGNPVYPFAYSVFGGKYWGEGETRSYEYHQKEFGVGDLPPAEEYWKLSASERRFIGPTAPLNLLLAPWNLTLNPVRFTVMWRQGSEALLPVLLQYWIGPLYLLGLLAALVLWLRDRRVPGEHSGAWSACGVLMAVFAPLWVWWLISMQLERYLMPSLALTAPVVGYALHRVASGIGRVLPLGVCALALAAAAYVAAPAATVVCGLLSADDYLRAACDVCSACRVTNEVTPENARIILYGEPRGFYLDRDYLWGDPGHHRLIPYDDLKTPEKLLPDLRSRGITHALLNVGQIGSWGPELGPPLSLLHEAEQEGLIHAVPSEKMPPGFLLLDLR